jgi:hypothetical protein
MCPALSVSLIDVTIVDLNIQQLWFIRVPRLEICLAQNL